MLTYGAIPMLLARVSAQRRQLGAQSLQAFAQLYLAAHFNQPPSRMHQELFAQLQQITTKRNQRVAVAAPRGHAKSTLVSLAYLLWCVLYEHEQMVLLVSATREQAVMLLKDVKEQIQNNPLIRDDFPEIWNTSGAPGKRVKPWRTDKIALANGAMVMAVGAGQAVRGTKHGRHRPGLIIVDDLENREQVLSEEQRTKTREWFHGTLLKAGNIGVNVVMVGTILHYDSLLANLIDPMKSPGWLGAKYRAVESFSNRPDLWEQWAAIFRGVEVFGEDKGPDAAKAFFESHREAMLEGTQVLWPQREDYHSLMVLRERETPGSFQAEKQNDPLDSETCIFREETFQYWDREYAQPAELVAAVGKHGRIYGACDPSLGRKGNRGDYTSIVLVLRDDRTKVNYVLAADLARRRPDQTIERILHYVQMYKVYEFAVEDNQFQEMLASQLEQRARQLGLSLRLKRITNSTDKKCRIESIEPMVTQGHIRFSRRHQQLLEQLKQFPLAAHDDGPDALEMAVRIANKPRHKLYVQQLF